MDPFVENTGVAQPEQKIQPVPAEGDKESHIAIENAETASPSLNEEDTTMWKNQGKEQQKQVGTVQEKPDPLLRRAANSPLNEMKAGYDYAFGKRAGRR